MPFLAVSWESFSGWRAVTTLFPFVPNIDGNTSRKDWELGVLKVINFTKNPSHDSEKHVEILWHFWHRPRWVGRGPVTRIRPGDRHWKKIKKLKILISIFYHYYIWYPLIYIYNFPLLSFYLISTISLLSFSIVISDFYHTWIMIYYTWIGNYDW